MKVKDLKAMLDQFGDEQEITFLSSSYDAYAGQDIFEEVGDVIVYLTYHDTVMLIPGGSDLYLVKKEITGMTLPDLMATGQLIQSKSLWTKLLQEKNNEETN